MGKVYYQKSGKFAAQAATYTNIRLTKGTPAAIHYFRALALDIPAPRDDDQNDMWWIYNCDDILRRQYAYKVIAGCRTPQEVMAALTRRYGGEWSYYEEY